MADYQEQIERNISLAEKRKNITYDGLSEEDNLKQLINELREVVPKLEPPIISAGKRSTKWSHVVKFPDSLEVEEKREALFPTRDGKLLGISPSHDNLILYRYIYCKINHSVPVYPYKIDGITITEQIHEFTGDDDKSRGLIIEMSLIRYEEDSVSIIDDWKIAADKADEEIDEEEIEGERDDEPLPPAKTLAELNEEYEKKQASKAQAGPEATVKKLLPPPSSGAKKRVPSSPSSPRPPNRKGRMTAAQEASEQLAQRLAGNGGREDDSDDD